MMRRGAQRSGFQRGSWLAGMCTWSIILLQWATCACEQRAYTWAHMCSAVALHPHTKANERAMNPHKTTVGTSKGVALSLAPHTGRPEVTCLGGHSDREVAHDPPPQGGQHGSGGPGVRLAAVTRG